MEDSEQNENRPASARIHPKKGDALLVSLLFLACIVVLALGRWGIVHERQIFIATGLFAYCMLVYVNLLRRVSIDSRKLRYYILGLIPVDIYWYDVAQIGMVFILAEHSITEKDTCVLGEMFVLVRKPCKKYEEGSKTLRWWNIRPKWRHPFLVKNIYCDTEKYKEIVEEYSGKKVSFERIYD